MDPIASRCLLVREPDRQVFTGACLDTGASRSVIGHGQGSAYARLTKTPIKPTNNYPSQFMFGGTVTPTLGTVDVRVPIGPTLFANLIIDIVEVDIPFLLGLDALDALSLYVKNVDDRLKCDKRGISTSLARKHEHIYLEWTNVVHYSMVELERLHRHFNHPAADRLAAVLHRADDPKAEPGTLQQLERLTAGCDVCQRLSRAPGGFRVAIPDDNIVFNRTILVDLMYLDGRILMHIVDKDTLYSAATFCHG